MAESKIKKTDFKKTVSTKEALNDPTMSTDEVEIVEKETLDIPVEDMLETNSSSKDIEIIDITDAREQKKGEGFDDSKGSGDITSEVEEDSETCSKVDVTINANIKEVDKTETSKEPDNTSAKNKATNVSDEEATLNEILKVVHENLSSNNVHQSAKESKDSKKEDSRVEETKEKIDEKSRKDNIPKEVVNVKTNVPVEVEAIKSRRDSESKQSVELVEHMEVGIVGPPTTVSELINEEELRAESAISTDQKVQDHVAEWVQNSAKAEELAAEEEETRIRDDQREKKTLREKRTRKKKNNDALALPTRKSQRIVSNIIKKSIKW